MRFMLVLLFTSLIYFSTACTTQQRGLSGQNYVSTSRPAIEIVVKDLPIQGSKRQIIKLQDMGMLGGLPLETNLSIYGNTTGPRLIIAHADVPTDWEWA